MAVDRLSQLTERGQVSAVVHRYATGVDQRDWALFRSCFEDEITMDLSSWNGAPPATLAADAWVAGVRAGLSGFDATQHISANHVVVFSEPALLRAQCTSYMQATHALDGARVTLGGYYETQLARRDGAWRIAESRLVVTWREGDEALFAAAAKRFAGAEAGR